MTEAEWLACDDIDRALAFIGPRLSPRKARLLACACCRRLGRRLVGERGVWSVEVAERYADGGKSDGQRLFAAVLVYPEAYTWRGCAALQAAHAALCEPLDLPRALALCREAVARPLDERMERFRAPFGEPPEPPGSAEEEGQAQCRLLREVAGDPFRPCPLRREWLQAGGWAAVHIAQEVYDRQRYDDLPVLADALEDAGCDQGELLAHLRGPDGHARGCWAVDTVLMQG